MTHDPLRTKKTLMWTWNVYLDSNGTEYAHVGQKKSERWYRVEHLSVPESDTEIMEIGEIDIPAQQQYTVDSWSY